MPVLPEIHDSPQPHLALTGTARDCGECLAEELSTYRYTRHHNPAYRRGTGFMRIDVADRRPLAHASGWDIPQHVNHAHCEPSRW